MVYLVFEANKHSKLPCNELAQKNDSCLRIILRS